MVYRIATAALALLLFAAPMRALEDEMGRIVDPSSTFSQDVVADVRDGQTRADPAMSLLVNLGAALAVLLTVGGMGWWWAGSNPRLRKLAAVLGALRVISRLRLGARHEILLLKVGERALVIGAGPRGLSTLSEFTDPAEVARLCAGEIAAPTAEPAAQSQQAMETPAQAPVSEPRLSPLRAELNKLAQNTAA